MMINAENINDIYNCLRKQALNYTTEYASSYLIERYGFDFRTVRALVNIVKNEPYLTKHDYLCLLNPNFYNLKNMLTLHKEGLDDLIPTRFYENYEFIRKSGITEIPKDFAKDNPYMEMFTIAPGIKKIGDYAFYNCVNLIMLTDTENLENVGVSAFENCKELTGIPVSLSHIGKRSFKNCKAIEQADLIGLDIIPNEAFSGCDNLHAISIQNNIDIEYRAFKGCRNLYLIEGNIGDTDKEAFKNCVNIKDITMVSSVIGEEAFAGCTNLENIRLECKMPNIVGEDAFIGCINLNHIVADGFMYQLTDISGYEELIKNLRFNKDGDDSIKVNKCIHSVISNLIKEQSRNNTLYVSSEDIEAPEDEDDTPIYEDNSTFKDKSQKVDIFTDDTPLNEENIF